MDSISITLPSEHMYLITNYGNVNQNLNYNFTSNSNTSTQNKNSNFKDNKETSIFTSFFSFVFTNSNGGYYYGHFLKIYEEEHVKLINANALVPKYLVFFSVNPFFISFKSLLEEIYINSLNKLNQF